MTTIEERFCELHPRSMALYERAQHSFPSGITHDVRLLRPSPIYVERANGSRKWDVDGNEIVDYVMGHGALLLGHSHPSLVEAVNEQVGKGTHYGANHELELSWSRAVGDLMPSAEAVCFTSSGTEATQMAIRLARASTGRDKIIKFDHHFHGWTDCLVGRRAQGSAMPRAAGVPQGTLINTISVHQSDLDTVRKWLMAREVAAVILEPTGASWGTWPLDSSLLAELRTITKQLGTLLIFDEVVTGFRVSSGGAQQQYNIMPDLTTLAKILAGGLPGGAVVGSSDFLSMIEFREDAEWNSHRRVAHPGTYNANPLSAAAGIAMLSQLGNGQLHLWADGQNRRLVMEMNAILTRHGVAGCVYGLASYFHILLGKDWPRPMDGVEWPIQKIASRNYPTMEGTVALSFRQAMLNHNVDLMGQASAGAAGGFVSAVHTDDDIDRTLVAFEASLKEMATEKVLV